MEAKPKEPTTLIKNGENAVVIIDFRKTFVTIIKTLKEIDLNKTKID